MVDARMTLFGVGVLATVGIGWAYGPRSQTVLPPPNYKPSPQELRAADCMRDTYVEVTRALGYFDEKQVLTRFYMTKCTQAHQAFQDVVGEQVAIQREVDLEKWLAANYR